MFTKLRGGKKKEDSTSKETPKDTPKGEKSKSSENKTPTTKEPVSDSPAQMAAPVSQPVNTADPKKVPSSSSSSAAKDNKNTGAVRHQHHSSVAVEPESLAAPLEKMRISQDDKKNLAAKPASGSGSTPGSTSTSGSSSSGSTKRREKQAISYAAERVIGNGSFGVVYQATVIETGETVAIKKVLQDRRFKNRELQMMGMLDHPNVVTLKHCFYSKGEKPDDVFLNLVMEYIPETIHRTLRNHTKAKKLVPLMYTKVYMYQVCRSLAYIHSLGICHRDIKPQNLLLNTKSHDVKLCDFGSAKILMRNEPNVAYICSRYYRAPELVFEATEYSCAIDIWSLGCVMAELLLGNPLFPGDSGVDQLIEIIKILGTPSREEIRAMNPNHTSFKFPQIKPHPWSKVFRGKAPAPAIDLVSQFLRYEPAQRLDPFEALCHPFFDELREPNARLPNGKPLPQLFNFTEGELKLADRKNLTYKVIPTHLLHKFGYPARPTDVRITPTPAYPPQPAAAPASPTASGSSSPTAAAGGLRDNAVPGAIPGAINMNGVTAGPSGANGSGDSSPPSVSP